MADPNDDCHRAARPWCDVWTSQLMQHKAARMKSFARSHTLFYVEALVSAPLLFVLASTMNLLHTPTTPGHVLLVVCVAVMVTKSCGTSISAPCLRIFVAETIITLHDILAALCFVYGALVALPTLNDGDFFTATFMGGFFSGMILFGLGFLWLWIWEVQPSCDGACSIGAVVLVSTVSFPLLIWVSATFVLSTSSTTLAALVFPRSRVFDVEEGLTSHLLLVFLGDDQPLLTSRLRHLMRYCVQHANLTNAGCARHRGKHEHRDHRKRELDAVDAATRHRESVEHLLDDDPIDSAALASLPTAALESTPHLELESLSTFTKCCCLVVKLVLLILACVPYVFFPRVAPLGVLFWSTVCTFVGGVVALLAAKRDVHVIAVTRTVLRVLNPATSRMSLAEWHAFVTFYAASSALDEVRYSVSVIPWNAMEVALEYLENSDVLLSVPTAAQTPLYAVP